MNKAANIKSVAVTAIFVAFIVALSQVTIPTPIGVSVTLQTFAISLTAFLLGTRRAIAATVCYVLLGAIGAPVFAGLSGGFGALLGPTGGFIFGFPVFALVLSFSIYVNRTTYKLLVFLSALLLLYISGTVQFIIVTGNSIKVAITAFLLYFTKDIAVVLVAYFLCVRIRPTVDKFIQPKR